MTPTAAVEASGLGKTFGQSNPIVRALRDIDLTIPRAQFVSIVGPSGSGKSTLLHLIGGLDQPTTGEVRIGDQHLASLDDDALTILRRRQIGFVFQAFNLLPILSAVENVALPLQFDGVSEARALDRAAGALELVGLADRRQHFPAELSGGEQQRVAIARAIINDPLILLADEPTGNLDSAAGDAITSMLRGFTTERGQTIVMVTHDPRHAAIADRTITLRDGRIVEDQLLQPGKSASELLADMR